ncbi:hypothetical protein LR48_Vigan10g072300 [Vigna angularis]|uniref:Uncharacterized protein n=1 Tax=Phaseolus angularis TaxID=3914 RepID=A0A0L9VIE4_PHAAN|nr:hypothetical protein LR48_Vigan10g072300 [Vigna angularis]
MAKLDDVFQQFMQESISTQKSIEASRKRKEMQISHFIEKLEGFGVETKVNPREECQAMITGSDKTLDEKEIERKEKEELSEKDKDVERERDVVEREDRKKICLKIKRLQFCSSTVTAGLQSAAQRLPNKPKLEHLSIPQYIFNSTQAPHQLMLSSESSSSPSSASSKSSSSSSSSIARASTAPTLLAYACSSCHAILDNEELLLMLAGKELAGIGLIWFLLLPFGYCSLESLAR